MTDSLHVPYAELHAHSHFSFLDGASSPAELVSEAERLGLHGLALTDHDGFYGVVQFAEAAERSPLQTMFGAELSLDIPCPQNGVADPMGTHLLVIARRQEGYHRLAGALTAAGLAEGAEKGRPLYDLNDLASRAEGEWAVLTGCRKSAVRQALHAGGIEAAGAEIDRLIAIFGYENIFVELFDHGHPLDTRNNDALAVLAHEKKLPLVATGIVHYATPDKHRLASALAAVRSRRNLDEMDGWLPATGNAFLRSGSEMMQRFRRYPGAIENTVPFSEEYSFNLRALKPGLPRHDVPSGHTPMTWLRELVERGIRTKYPSANDSVHERLQRELALIEEKDFPGYFLIVHDIVMFARSQGILCQGRGSAANSAVCYVLDITAVDSIAYDLPFERFMSSMREEEPDIDVDFDSGRREEVIQYVYKKYGRLNAAQVSNVISYRPKYAIRDMSKALGYAPGQQDAWSKNMDSWRKITPSDDHDIPDDVQELARQVLRFPRHLGIHSGGMVLTDRPVGEVVPIENARMEKRTVLQWDKDDCAWMGLVKFDLLGLGMLEALHRCFVMIEECFGETWTLSSLPKEEQAVYDMLCIADVIGVFQVESRAQMATLPRLRPRCFYDLVIEIALIRPGPIQGKAVHPLIRRRLGEEPITYPHPLLEPALKRTFGVPLFQEQLMQMAMIVGGCSADDADLLRRAMGSKRGVERIESLKEKLYVGMASNGIVGSAADDIYSRIESFASFGFAESHSISFALLVYASSWLKLHYPAVFLAALLASQPMGFYSPQSLVADARRHGVVVRKPHIGCSGVNATLESLEKNDATAETISVTSRDACFGPHTPSSPFDPANVKELPSHRRDANAAVRLGLAGIRSIGQTRAERIVTEREQFGPYTSMSDLAQRAGLSSLNLEALAAAGALEEFGHTRREALWLAGPASRQHPDHLSFSSVVALQPPLFSLLTDTEKKSFDMWSLGLSPNDHPVSHVRDFLVNRGVLTAEQLKEAEPARRIEIGGIITHRQRPATAGGVTFLNVEDETGLVNVIVTVGTWKRFRRVARTKPAVIVRGILERSPHGVINLLADRIEPLSLGIKTTSRDFR